MLFKIDLSILNNTNCIVNIEICANNVETISTEDIFENINFSIRYSIARNRFLRRQKDLARSKKIFLFIVLSYRRIRFRIIVVWNHDP